MTRLEAFKKTAMGATMAAALVAVLSPSSAQSAPTGRDEMLAKRQARLETRAQRQQEIAAFREGTRKLDRYSRVLEDISDRLERRAWELEWLISSYRAMNDEISWALGQAGGTLTPEDSLDIAANVMMKHLGAIESSGISAMPDSSANAPERIQSPATPQGLSRGGLGFLGSVEERIEELATEIGMRSMEVYAEEGRAGGISSAVDALVAFGSGVERDVEKASERLEDFRGLVEAPSLR